MNRAMYAAASGMAAQQTNLETIADNLANADVAGFKQMTATFVALNAGGTGLGTAVAGKHPEFVQGKLMRSNGPFDVAIDGAGFFRVERNGVAGYTRNGEFARAADGSLRNAGGWTLRDVRVPADATAVHVGPDGAVTIEGDRGAVRAAGHIRLAAFAAPDELQPLDATVFGATPQSGPERRLAAGGEHQPAIRFNMLERSNVSIIESMMQIMTAQRAYEANAKGVQAADEMQRIANNINRG